MPRTLTRGQACGFPPARARGPESLRLRNGLRTSAPGDHVAPTQDLLRPLERREDGVVALENVLAVPLLGQELQHELLVGDALRKVRSQVVPDLDPVGC